MIKNLIVGSGFSASMVKIMINDNVKVASLKNTNSLRSENFIRRTNLECNKFFSENTLSVGSTEFILNKAKFHDRLILGGNSNIWGGHIDLKRISENLVNFLIKKKIFFKKLSFRITGTTSHNKDLAQLQTSSGKILKAQDLLGKVENIFILDFFIKNKKIFVNLLYLNSLKKKQITFFNDVVDMLVDNTEVIIHDIPLNDQTDEIIGRGPYIKPPFLNHVRYPQFELEEDILFYDFSFFGGDYKKYMYDIFGFNDNEILTIWAPYYRSLQKKVEDVIERDRVTYGDD